MRLASASLRLTLLLAGAAFATSGCGADAAPPGEAQDRIRSTVPGLIDESAAAIGFLDESVVWEDLGASMASLNQTFAAMPFQFPFASEGATYGKRFVATHLPDHETPGQAFARFLAERVFTAANYEGDGVYRLRGADFCPEDFEGQPDAECVEQFDAAELRVRATLAGDGLDVTLLVGPERAEPLTIELRKQSIALVVDLAEAKAALRHLAKVTGEDLQLPSVMEGRIAVSLTVNGPKDVTLAAAIRSTVRVEAKLEDGADVKFSTAKKDPLWSVRAQAIQRRLTLDVDVGVTTLSIPWRYVGAEGTGSGQLEVDWKGWSASVVLEEGQSSLRLTNLGIGDGRSTISLDGEELLSLELNPSSGRRFALEIDGVPGELPMFSIDPEFDLIVGVHLAPLAARGEPVESYLMDETYRITFNGTSPTAQPVPDALRIHSGTLTISSTAASAPVVVTAGQCLIGADAVTSGEHPLLGHLAAVDCP